MHVPVQVLVWSHLIDFLKDVLIRYPQVKDEISENKVGW